MYSIEDIRTNKTKGNMEKEENMRPGSGWGWWVVGVCAPITEKDWF